MLNLRSTAIALSLIALLVTLIEATQAVDDLSFHAHTINGDSTYSACSVMDVNGDGALDIISGGLWYAAPNWKRHFLREVPMIRGRYDGYSELPLDVNGDGRLDLVSANYRSQALYWLEQPAASLEPWKVHEVATPGPMETARLIDIDGDGQLDVLPNGVKFAAWWELKREADSAPKWIRHDLPTEIAGHGVGFGDLNGDGRGDIIGPRGWLQAPQDPRRGRWALRAEFELSRDCGLPILVLDVDGDEDNDILWSRGHSFGLYWLEQVQTTAASEDGSTETPQREWVRHAIDTSWSQYHSLLTADLDNDGRVEVIAGKRYMGHDGRDLGEHDPLVVNAYTFQPQTHTWRRRNIAHGWKIGCGLDPKVADIDGDGDLDLVAAGRSGLYLLENRLNDKDATPKKPASEPSPYEDHSRLLEYRDSDGKPHPVKSAADWARRREHILSWTQRVMGQLPGPENRVPLDVQILEEVKTEHYTRKKITYAAEPGDRVPAYLLVPNHLKERAPAMLCLHQTTGIGKGEPAGLGGRETLRYAQELAERGYVCLAPDYPSFGDYQFDFKQDGRLPSGSMKAIWNNLRAVDLLQTLPEVDNDRIGCVGHSLGGHNTIFTAVFDQRLKAMISSCGFTAFHHYYGGRLAGWTSDRYMPRIREQYDNDPDQVPFDFYELIAALAPRPFFANAPQKDSNFDVAGVKKIEAAAGQVYRLLGNPEGLKFVYPDSAHDFPDEVREQSYEWLDAVLKK